MIAETPALRRACDGGSRKSFFALRLAGWTKRPAGRHNFTPGEAILAEVNVLVPFLKWAGGKRWLFSADFIERLPAYQRYIEPFLGGGAGFFALNPPTSILADINPELIELYRIVRNFPTKLSLALARHQAAHCSRHYYEVRASTPTGQVDRAARTLYLNRTCWNGLYRLNQAGLFNVPIGTKTAVLLATDDFSSISRRLKKAELLVRDFEDVVKLAKEGDLLFVDPPYTVHHNLNGFIKYNEKIFSWDDQVRLAAAVAQASRRGASVIVTNANHSSVRDLYSHLGCLEVAKRSSVISGKSSGRALTSELIVRI